MYPGLSAKIFTTFNCGKVVYADVDEEFLLADYSIDCDDPAHKTAEAFAGICVACICIGTPVLYLVLLWRSHNAVQSGAHSARHLHFLVADYRPECWCVWCLLHHVVCPPPMISQAHPALFTSPFRYF